MLSNNNASVVGVTVNLSGTTNAAVTTDSVGNYQFSGLTAGGYYIVSPSFVRHYFTPPNRTFYNLTSNQTGNFEVLGVCQNGNCVKNGMIAFVRNGEIFTKNPNGGFETNITNNVATDGGPNYSADGTKIAFSTDRDGNNEIYQMNADGSNPVNLTNNAASDVSPYYSPDGRSIVFLSGRDGNSEVYKMNADGSNQVRLTNTVGTEASPAFSPDGPKIIHVVFNSRGPVTLFTMNADGSNQQQFPDVGYYNRPSYSPDGTKIIFVYGTDVTSQNIWTMNANGSNCAQAPFGRSSPSYSPDGTKVVHACCFFSGGPAPNGLRVSNVGGGSTQLTTGNFDDFPDWQPIPVPRPAPFDFDGDGRSDISVYRPSNYVWYLLRTSAGFVFREWGLTERRPRARRL